MKLVKSILSFAFLLIFIIVLNTRIAPLPPLGKFLDPFQGFWANARTADKHETLIKTGIYTNPVKIVYDDLLVPHIFADNEPDLYRAAGYTHAMHRLWQMEIQTHAAGGRLSEIVGELTLDMDRIQRRKGMVYGAENFIKHLDDTARMVIDSYTQGVNAYISSLNYADFPLEYKLLDYKPEPWTALKSGLLYKYMSDMLNSFERDLENTNFLSIYGRDMLDLLYPDVDNFEDPVVDNPAWGFEPLKKNQMSSNAEGPLAGLEQLSYHNPNNGSNNWAVGSGRSATGYAMLANDMHLNLYMPSLWYYMQLHCGDIRVFGHTLPGIPVVITGFTDSIAWGLTNAQRDLVDWYKIEFENQSKDRYLLDGKYVATEKRIETIKIRGKKAYTDTVVYTVFGPVAYDANFRAESEKNGYAYRWIDHDPSPGLMMFYMMNKARSFEDYMKALDNFTSPAQNVVFASVKGDIAHRVQGKYPLNNFEEGKFLKDGTRSENNWTAYIPNEHNAFWKNPERGFVSSANQHPANAAYPYYVTADRFEAYRNRRINQVLGEDRLVTLEDMKKLHFDNYSLKAAESLPWMLDQLRGMQLNAVENAIVGNLVTWDYFFDVESEAATYFDIWIRNLISATWDEIKVSNDQGVRLAFPTSYATIRLMKSDPENIFFDHQATDEKESAGDLARMAFREMIAEVATIRENKKDLAWGNYKSTFVGHQLGIPSLGFHDIPCGGNGDDIVNATGRNNGPSQRIIVELDPAGVKAWGHYPGGQSGHPGSKYYDNMVMPWANGEYFELLMLDNPDAKQDRVLFSQTLQ